MAWLTNPKCALRLHGQQVPIIRDEIQDVLVHIDQRTQHTLLLQPLLTQKAPPRHKQDMEVTWRAEFVLTAREACARAHAHKKHV